MGYNDSDLKAANEAKDKTIETLQEQISTLAQGFKDQHEATLNQYELIDRLQNALDGRQDDADSGPGLC